MIAVAENKVHSPTQGSPEWHAQRCGKITMSNVGLLAAEPRGNKPWTDGALTYARRLAVERITGKPVDSGGSTATEWGNNQEDAARAAYEFAKGVSTVETGYIPLTAYCGGSPDGFTIDGDHCGIHEVKCPHNPVNHFVCFESGMPKQHYAQVQGNLMVTDAPWCDFVSFDPRMPAECRLYVERIRQDETYIKQLWKKVQTFDQYIQQLVSMVRKA